MHLGIEMLRAIIGWHLHNITILCDDDMFWREVTITSYYKIIV